MVDFNKLADAIPDDMKKKVEEELKNAAMSKFGMTNTGQSSEASPTGEVNQNPSDDAINQNAADADQTDSAQDDKSDAA